MSRLSLCLPLLLVLSCSEAVERDDDAGTPGKYEATLDDSLLANIVVGFLRGRCVGKVSINANDAGAKKAIISFTKGVAEIIPLDGSKPTTDEELKALVPKSGAVDGWQEDPKDTTKGPWLVTTNAFDWINGAAKPYADNGFEAVAGDDYVKTSPAWTLKLELVNQGSTTNAEATYKQSDLSKGTKLSL